MDQRVLFVLKKLTSQHIHKVRLAAVVKEAGLSRRRLEQLFQQELGQTPGRFLRERKMNAARTMLRKSLFTIKQIATKVGYKAAPVFCRTFKRANRCTATRYRRNFAKRQQIAQNVNQFRLTAKSRRNKMRTAT